MCKVASHTPRLLMYKPEHVSICSQAQGQHRHDSSVAMETALTKLGDRALVAARLW